MGEALESGAVLGAGPSSARSAAGRWLNTAHQGPLPRRAVAAAGHAAALKAHLFNTPADIDQALEALHTPPRCGP
jgi:hypothetical protein